MLGGNERAFFDLNADLRSDGLAFIGNLLLIVLVPLLVLAAWPQASAATPVLDAFSFFPG